jgi:hypothetical protein
MTTETKNVSEANKTCSAIVNNDEVLVKNVSELNSPFFVVKLISSYGPLRKSFWKHLQTEK